MLVSRSRPKNAKPVGLYEEAVRLRMKENLKNEEIAQRLGITIQLVWYWMGPTPRSRGGTQSTWPYELRQRARYLKDCGHSVREISREMKVPRSTIGDWTVG